MTVSEMQERIALLESEIVVLCEKLERAEEIAGIKRGIDETNRGEFIPLRQFDEEMRAKYKIPK